MFTDKRVWVQFDTDRRRTQQNPTFSENDRSMYGILELQQMKQIFSFPSNNKTVKVLRQPWINGFKVKVELEHPAGLINPLAHHGCGEDGQPTNHHRVCVFYMIKHMQGALNHPYLA